jgi:protein-L-isoaspartate(D-aspartate) O-methyltransferase
MSIPDPITEQARANMIVQQIRPWDVVDDRVLEALEYIPREQFVPAEYRDLAFADIEVPLPHQQCMMSPKLEARMLQALNVQPGNRVLEIGTGTGFITACLAHLGGEVTSLDIYADFTDQAVARLTALGLKATLVTQDALKVLPKTGSWDVVAVTGSMAQMDERFKKLLADNGRLFMVIGEPPAMKAMLITRMPSGAFHEEVLFETALCPLENAPQPDSFVF